MPKPRIAVHIGITGHRSNRLGPEDRATIEKALSTLFRMIDDSIAKIARETQNRVYAPVAPLIGIVSALADGADRYAVAAVPTDWRLEAILPMPRAEYAHDFQDTASGESHGEFDRLLTRADSVTELPLLPTVDIREDAGRALHYEALEAFLVSQIDLLVAVWDGGPAKGPGGTAAVVTRALGAGRPVLWVDPANAMTPRLLFAVDNVTYNEHRSEITDADRLDRLLRDLLMPPAVPASASDKHDGTGNPKIVDQHPAAIAAVPELPSYFRIPWLKPMRLPLAYNLLRWLSGAGRWSWPITYPSFNDLSRNWNEFFDTSAGAASEVIGPFNERLRSILLPRSIWADALAWYYGHLYRSAYVSIFLLAGLSVPVGLCYLFFLDNPAVLDIKAGFVAIELLIISTVMMIVRRGTRDNWHAVWLDIRELSELLRLGRTLAHVGASHDFVATPQAGGRETFLAWYVRATFREIGLPNGVLDDGYLRSVLTATLTTEIAEQQAYHTANARNLKKIHHLLHHKGDACFVATIFFLLLYLAAWLFDHTLPMAMISAPSAGETDGGFVRVFHEFLEYYLKPTVSIAAAGLPALGAALSGIRAQGDFEGFAQRSTMTQHELVEIDHQIASLLSTPDRIGLTAATDVLLAAAHVMAKDVSAWQKLYISKRLALPA